MSSTIFKFIQQNQTKTVQTIAGRITKELQANKRVLWLTSGGSNIALEAAMMELLHAHAEEQLGGLAILPMDERYGKPGHADSNSQALREAGFKPGAASWIDILAQDVSFDQTISFYNDVVATALANAHIVIAQFGLGDDGHIAGIKPGSPAAEDDATTVAGYEWSDYTRLTMTPMALLQANVAFVPAYGTAKNDALIRLRKNDEPIASLPAHLLYDIPETYVFTDQAITKLESESQI